MSDDFMKAALQEAKVAFDQGEVPIGAVLVRDGTVLARAHNTREQSKNPLHHAEIQVLEEAARTLGDWRLSDCTLYVTLEPCPMCLGALFQARVGKLIFGCYDDKRTPGHPMNAGNVIFPNLRDVTTLTSNNHTLNIAGGILEAECAALLKTFFAARRGKA